ncbi:MAG: hypothetical protein EXR99_04025 [Gemmataceae bacterium]|nr:hypothetical protein [Gemmataceae bacterium]
MRLLALLISGFLVGNLLLEWPLAQSQEPPDGAAKERDPRKDGFRSFFKKPETLMDFWEAIAFEMDVGKYDFAYRYIKEMSAKQFPDADLVALVNKVSLSAVMNLRLVKVWVEEPAENTKARAEVEAFVGKATDAHYKSLRDPELVKQWIKLLQGDPEERKFALNQIYRSGEFAVPLLIDALSHVGTAEKTFILGALLRLGKEVNQPIAAALEGVTPDLQVDLMDVLIRRNAAEAVPEMWFLAGDPSRLPEVRRKARMAIALLTNREADALGDPKVELLALAEKYYQGRGNFLNPAMVKIWRWDGKAVVIGWPGVPTVDAKSAAAYFCSRYASLAILLDPLDQGAQVLQLINSIQGHLAKTDIRLPIRMTNPALYLLLTTVQPDLLLAVMDRALQEKKTAVVLALTRTLGETKETRAARPRLKKVPALVEALNYGDRRVEFAAAYALVQIPNSRTANASAEVVEVLSRALRSEPMEKDRVRVLLGIVDQVWGQRVATAMRSAGMDPIVVSTGRQILRRLEKAADIDAVFLESTLPDPGLHHLLASIRGESYAAKLPVFLAAIPEGNRPRDAVEKYGNASRRVELMKPMLAPYLREKEGVDLEYQRDLEKVEDRKKKETKLAKAGPQPESQLFQIEKDYELGLVSAREQLDQGIKKITFRHSGVFKTLAERDLLTKQMGYLADQFDLYETRRVEDLRKHFEKQEQIQVVHPRHFTNVNALRADIHLVMAEIGAPPLSEEERAVFAHMAVEALARIARGELPGYDARPATQALLSALTPGRLSDQGMFPLIDALSNLALGRVQPELGAIVMDAKRAPQVRVAAVRALTTHVQRYGILMVKDEVEVLEKYCLKPQGEPGLVLEFSSLVGALKPSSGASTKRLLEFPGPVPGFPPAPKAPPKPEEKKEKKKDDAK